MANPWYSADRDRWYVNLPDPESGQQRPYTLPESYNDGQSPGGTKDEISSSDSSASGNSSDDD